VKFCDSLGKKSVDKNCWKQHPGLTTAVVWGDSHAEHLFPGLVELENKFNWMLLGRNICPPFLGIKAYWLGKREACQKANDKIFNFIKAHDSIKTVVIGFIGLFYLNDNQTDMFGLGYSAPKNFHLERLNHPELSKKDVFIQGLENTISALEKLGKNIVIVEDVPLLPFMPEACISRPLKYQNLPCDLPKSFVMQVQQDYHNILIQMQAKHPGLKLFSGIDAICNKRSCPVIQNAHLVYRDSQHLSLAGSQILAQALINQHLT
jgi:hypothetical protein